MPPVAVSIPAAQIAREVDELGALERELAPIQFKVARLEELRKAIRAHFENSPAAEPFEAKGEKFVVLVGPRGNQSVIDLRKVIKAVGLKAFAAFATCSLKALEAHAPGISSSVVTTERTGPRSLKCFERGVNGQ